MTFFDEEPDALTEQRRRRQADRAGRRGPGRRSRADRPEREPRAPRAARGGGDGPGLQGRQRTLVLIGAAVLLLVIAVFVVRGCQRSREVDSYKTYVEAANRIGTDSANLGGELERAFGALSRQTDRAELARAVDALAKRQAGLVDEARALTPPDALSGPNAIFVLAMEYRGFGLRDLSAQVAAALEDRDTQGAATRLAEPTARLVASDVLYADSFVGPTKEALQAQEVTGVEPQVSRFLPEGSNLVGRAGIAAALGGSSQPDVNVTGRRGTELTTVAALPAEQELAPDGQNQVAAAELSLRVTVENQGEVDEPEIQVKVTLGKGAGELANTEFAGVVADVAAGETGSTEIPIASALATPLPFDAPITFKVESVPLKGEKFRNNNTKSYTLILTP